MYGGDSLDSEPATTGNDRPRPGYQANPLNFSDASLKAMAKAALSRQATVAKATPKKVDAKAFSTVDSLLPPQLLPGIVAHQHEWRLMDRLPIIPISAPSAEYIQHNFAADTGGPGFVSEGGTKPEYVPASVSQTVTAMKLAVHTGITHETLMDAPQWLSYVETELFRQVWDQENSALLSGSGTAPNILGFFKRFRDINALLQHRP
jgi:HK97 family phage major capsid protein